MSGDPTSTIHRAICQERCAYRGKPACWQVDGVRPNPNCDEPGCHALTLAAVRALEGGDV